MINYKVLGSESDDGKESKWSQQAKSNVINIALLHGFTFEIKKNSKKSNIIYQATHPVILTFLGWRVNYKSRSIDIL